METNMIENINAVTEQIIKIHQEAKFLSRLTPEQRDAYKGRVTPKYLRLLPNRVEAARRNRKLIPSTFDLAKLEQDAALTVSLGALEDALRKFQRDAHDSVLDVGHAAVVGANSAHTYIRVASLTTERMKPTEHTRKTRSSRAAAAVSTSPPMPVTPVASGNGELVLPRAA